MGGIHLPTYSQKTEKVFIDFAKFNIVGKIDQSTGLENVIKETFYCNFPVFG